MARKRIFAGVRQVFPTIGSRIPARRFWSHWMLRALAPHEGEMAVSRRPILAIEIELE